MTGQLFAVVGPSGAGKDTLMEAAQAAQRDVVLVRRVITRPSSAGGEAFHGVSETEFETRKARGEFVIDWSAHGLRYGIPAAVRDDLAAGRTVLFNGSRAALPEAMRQFPELKVLLITASTEVLANRLAARGRESIEEIELRLRRADYALPDGLDVTEIANDGTLEAAVAALLAAIQPVRA